jgi:thioredoxin reductase
MSGLAAARELRREDHAVTVMEQSDDVGGQWLYDPRTDSDNLLGAKALVKVHSSMYASARVISPRECMGFSDFQFVPRPGGGRDARRYPGHREVYCYLRDFCQAFGLADAVRLNTRVVRVAMAPLPPPRDARSSGGGGDYSDMKWTVRSVHVEPGPGGGEAEVAVDEVFDAVVVANGHYSQPRLPNIEGMDVWQRRQLHSHSYREPEPFRDEVVVVVGCGESGLDIATELSGVAKQVHLTARSVEAATTPPPMVSKILSKHAGIRLHPHVDRLREDGRVEFADGCRVVADAVIYCTGYTYSFPFLDTGGLVTVRDNRVGPLYEHTFPPALAPSLSFVGVPMRVFAPWFFEAQARWIALVLSGKAALPPEEDMLRAVQEDYRAREIAGVPTSLTHAIPALDHRVCMYVSSMT